MSQVSWLDENGVAYLWSKIKGMFAPKASPEFTGDPKAPTQATTDNSTKIATTAFVKNAMAGIGGATYSLTQSAQDGHVITLSGTDGTSDTITIPDNDTTYNPATQAIDGLMSSTDKTKLDGFGSASDYALKSEIAGIYKYKGSVATESLLPVSGMSGGDVYNIEAESQYGPAGQNVAWDATNNRWDPLGGIFTITAITNAELDVICV